MNAGYDVKKSEVHGMAQRGGSVVSQVRYGAKVYSPLIRQGDADIIVSFEKMEVLRYLDFLKEDGIIIYNNQKITPLSVYSSGVNYPENINELCKGKTNRVSEVNAIALAEEIGNPKVLNSVMLGALSNYLNFESHIWIDMLSKVVPPKTIDMNLRAFAAGQRMTKN